MLVNHELRHPQQAPALGSGQDVLAVVACLSLGRTVVRLAVHLHQQPDLREGQVHHVGAEQVLRDEDQARVAQPLPKDLFQATGSQVRELDLVGLDARRRAEPGVRGAPALPWQVEGRAAP